MDFVVEQYNWWRAGHIVFVIFWMAALLFLPRKFVYQFRTPVNSAASADLINQQKVLIRIIMNPSGMGAWLFGVLLLFANYGRSGSLEIFQQPAWIIKLVLVVIMSCFHVFYLISHKNFCYENRTHSEKFWRILNEGPAILSILIVVTAVVYI